MGKQSPAQRLGRNSTKMGARNTGESKKQAVARVLASIQRSHETRRIAAQVRFFM